VEREFCENTTGSQNQANERNGKACFDISEEAKIFFATVGGKHPSLSAK